LVTFGRGRGLFGSHLLLWGRSGSLACSGEGRLINLFEKWHAQLGTQLVGLANGGSDIAD